MGLIHEIKNAKKSRETATLKNTKENRFTVVTSIYDGNLKKKFQKKIKTNKQANTIKMIFCKYVMKTSPKIKCQNKKRKKDLK